MSITDREVAIAQTMPAGTLGIWLFLASEGMFFLAIFSALVVLQSAGDQHQLFVHSSQMLSRWIGVGSVLLLILSSAVMMKKQKMFYWISLALAAMFLIIQCRQWSLLRSRETVVYRQGDQLFVADGGTWWIPLPDKFDIFTATAGDFPPGQSVGGRSGHWDEIKLRWNYGPSRNNFFATYFFVTVSHCVHLIAGAAVVLWMLAFRNGKLPAPLQIYWHFVNAVGVIGVAALYWI